MTLKITEYIKCFCLRGPYDGALASLGDIDERIDALESGGGGGGLNVEVVETPIATGAETVAPTPSTLTTVLFVTANVVRYSGTEIISAGGFNGTNDTPVFDLHGTPSANGTHGMITTYIGNA